MNVCKKIRYFKGCGKCLVSLSNDDIIKRISIPCMAQITDMLLECCVNNSNKKIIIDSSTVSCSGALEIDYELNVDGNHMLHNRMQCRNFMKYWYSFHKSIFIDAFILMYISSACDILKSTYREKEIKERIETLDNACNFFWQSNERNNDK